MSLMYSSVKQFSKMVKQLDGWLDKAVAHAKARSFDPVVLLQSRLAPDQYPLVRQVQAACDAAKLGVAAFLDGIKEADLAGAETRKITLPWLEGKYLEGADFLLESAQPNFYFHVAHAYAILRHNGVDLGKRDYIGSLTTHDA